MARLRCGYPGITWRESIIKRSASSSVRKAAPGNGPAKKKTVRANPSPVGPGVGIVGIGASAGGLEALEQFLARVPAGCGLAFVIVQHLDPSRKGMLVELLQHCTPMPVVQIKDRMRVEADRVYVIPPDRDLSVLNGVLHLLEPVAPRGLRLPIDYFFCSLADDQRQAGVGVVLSGMGSDGTLGLRAIKEKGGAVFAQAPESAKFDSMPRSVIEAGLADGVAAAEDLPGKIIDHLKHPSAHALTSETEPRQVETDQSALEKVVLLLRTRTGHDFSLYKKSTIYRRIERRMGLHQLARITDYVRYLRENPQEADLLFRELLIGVTGFFRDPTVWEQLKTDVIPALLAAHPNGGVLRAWVAGCSTGEEAYSLAIMFIEAVALVKPSAQYGLQIFATDLDKEAIDKARAGNYPKTIAADVSAARLGRFFVKEETGYRVGKMIREMVIFAPQNLVMDPPFTKLDLLTCRNLLIYLEADLQKKLFPLFHYSLAPGGVLLLGNSETVGQTHDLFSPLPGKGRFYRRQEDKLRAGSVDFPPAFGGRRTDRSNEPPPPSAVSSAPNLQALTESLLLKNHTSPAVLTTAKGDILYISGKTGRYLEPAAGRANLNLFAMARDGLGPVLHEAYTKALRDKLAVEIKAVRVDAGAGQSHNVDVSVQVLSEPVALTGMILIVFGPSVPVAPEKTDDRTKRPSRGNVRVGDLVENLRQCRDELRTTREEMQTSQEELRSANEELQSTNEELQSTNEELTTSKEEMQSMNEELQTVNHELQAKVDELSRSSDDMKNLLNSTDIATLFLDADLKVRRFTKRTAAIIKLLPGDAGHPITDLVSDLDYSALAEDAREVLRTLAFCERQVPASGERSFTVRIMPYRTQDNRIDGLVITFVDISKSKSLEAGLREAQAVMEGRLAAQAIKLKKSRAPRRDKPGTAP